MRRPEPTRDEIIACRNAGMTREQTGQALNTTIHVIKRLLVKYELTRQKTVAAVVAMPAEEANTRVPLMDQVKALIGKRMGETPFGYTLDGRPASSVQLIRASGLKPAWLGNRRT